MKQKLVYDIEIYQNYALFSFSNLAGTKFIELQMYPGKELNREKLKQTILNNTIITFNGTNFDMPLTYLAIRGASCERLKEVCDHIIETGDPHWKTNRRFNIRELNGVDHIDIKEPAPGVMISLKLYGARLSFSKLQDLPIEPSALITPAQREELRLYCRNDLGTTAALYQSLNKDMALLVQMSEQYSVDLRSKSGAQVATSVIKHYLEDIGVDTCKRVIKPGTSYRYDMPDWIKFDTPELNAVKQLVLLSDFVVGDSGKVAMPDLLKKVIKFDGAKYKFGIGGLHSQEKKQAIICGENQVFGEFDYSSFYPFLILNQRLFPKHLGPKFLTVYQSIVDRRIAAKASGDKTTADSLKLVINSSFGLFGSKYSFLYSPDLLIQTTITGQLCLFMLIEKVVACGGKVVSANTDGINIICHKDKFAEIQAQLDCSDLETGMNLEFTEYQATYNESVNSYVAVMKNGDIKGKGTYADVSLQKNIVSRICVDAVKAYLMTKTPVEQTIKACKDITQFLSVRSVKGGGVWRDQYLGKVVRFYYSTDGSTINYKTNSNKVAKSDGCKPMMDLVDKIPSDLNYQWYIDEAIKMIGLVGVTYA